MGHGSRTISIGSNVAERAVFPGLALYSMSKTALVGMTKGLARELGPRGISATLLGHARGRVDGDAAVTLHHHELEEPLGFLPDGSFDLAVVALVHHHLEARTHLPAEPHRVLRPGGTLLLSTVHPTADWVWHGGSYFD